MPRKLFVKKEISSSSSESDSEKRALKRLSVFNNVNIEINIPHEEKQEVDNSDDHGCTSCFKALTQCIRR